MQAIFDRSTISSRIQTNESEFEERTFSLHSRKTTKSIIGQGFVYRLHLLDIVVYKDLAVSYIII